MSIDIVDDSLKYAIESKAKKDYQLTQTGRSGTNFVYADDLGNTEYNKSLSERRATAVKNLIEKAGINASRLNINALGEDSLSGSKSKDARSFVRKVTFKLK